MQSALKSRDEYLRKLEHAGFDEASYGEYLRQELSGAKYLRARSSESPVVSDDEVAAAYKENLHRYQTPESVQARHILIKVAPSASEEQRAAARRRIEAIREQLRGGADFAQLARSSSEDTSAFEGGDLGAVPRGKTVKPFEDALFALAPGQVSDVVQTNSGFHLIRAGERAPATTQPLDAVRDGIRARLLAEKRTALARELVAKLRAAARVEVLVPLSTD
jgi:peptidyl-prolyl cis-trans isomerase C